MYYIWLFYVEDTLVDLRKVILLKDVCFCWFFLFYTGSGANLLDL